MQESDPKTFSNYILEGKTYFIRDGEVFTYDEDLNTVKTDILPSSLEIYGECTDDPLFELKVLSIKQHPDGSAFITAEDGSEIEFTFIDKEYSSHKNDYTVGEKGIYQIQAELLSVKVPRNSREGVSLTGEDAKKFFAWVEDEVEEDAVATVGFKDVAVFAKRKDFLSTGNYNFYGMVNTVAFYSVSEEIDEPDLSKICGFTIPMMNQWNKNKPRFVSASFEYPEYYNGQINENCAVKAVLHFVARHGKTNALYEYGTNYTVSPEERGLYGHDDDEYEEDEDGNRWLKDDDDDDCTVLSF